MKRLLSAFIAIALIISMLGTSAIFAAPAAVKITADEGWTNATYDEETGIITDLDGGYSLALEGNTVTFVPDQNITAEKIVIPSSVETPDGVLKITTVSNGVLAGAKHSNNNSSLKNESVKEIVISEGVTTIGEYAFLNSTALESVSLPSTLTAINNYGFSKCTLLSDIEIPKNITTLGKGAFYNCKAITSITLPATLTKFGGNEVFRGCSALETLVLSPTMTDTNSGGSVFRDCTALTSIEFPETLTQVRKNDFYNCTSLKNVIFTQLTAPTVSSSAFSKCSDLIVTIPAEGNGYEAEWQEMFPDSTTFVYTQGNPRVKNAVLDGNNLIGATLTATYTFFDPQNREESGSEVVWEACTESDFASAEVIKLKTENCSASAPSTYLVTDADNGKYIRATVTPRNADTVYNEGKPVSMQLEEKVRIPQTIPTVTILDPVNDQEVAVNKPMTLEASATCDNTTITKVEFYINDSMVAELSAVPYETTYTPTAMGDCTIYAKAYNALGETQVSETVNFTVVEKVPIFSIKTSSPDNWGGWNGTSAEKVAGAAEDGVSEAWVITGGSGGGGTQFSLNVSGFAASTTTHTDEDGNTLGKTKGLVDASEFCIRYKSTKSFSVKFWLEYRASKDPTKKSASVSVPATDGEWATAKLKMSDFAPGEEIEDMWYQNIYGQYTSNFEPVVLFRIEPLNLGSTGELVIDSFGANWYEEDMVTKAEWEVEPKDTYYQYYDDFDYSTGSIKIYRGNSIEPSEVLSLTDPRVSISGFKNTTIKDNETDSKNLKITYTVLNQTITDYVRVIPFAPPTLETIQVNEPKTEYYVGDPFDYDTGLIQANYSDKDPEFARLDDENTTIEGFDTTTAGTKTVTVTYGAKTCTYNINVSDYTVPGITSIKVDGVRKIYTVGEAFNYHDGSITPYKGSTAQKELKLYDRYAKVTGFDSSEACEDQEITVTYSGVSTTYTIDIIDDQAPVAYYNELDFSDGNRPAIWYSSGGSSSFVEGAGKDGISTGWYFTGSGTHQAALTGGWAGGNSETNIGTTASGLKGVDAIAITYKSQGSGSIQFKLDYRASDEPTKSSASVPFSSTGGLWKTIVLPIADFEPEPKGESTDEQIDSVDWVYNNIKGGYTTNFEPVVMMYLKSSNSSGLSTTIDNIRGLWYDNLKTVESIEITPSRTTYYEGQQMDLTGDVTITYDDGTEATGTMADFDITYTGFDTSAAPGKYTVTASYAGKTDSFEIELLEGGDDVESSSLSDDIRTVYLVGEEFDTSVGNITITRVNGEKTVIPLSDDEVTITGFDSSVQSTNVQVVIKYQDLSFNLTVRVYTPVIMYSSPSFTDANGNAITSFGAEETVVANIKARNRIACPSPQSACILAVAYGENNNVEMIKQIDPTVLPASSEITISASFTAEELKDAVKIKIIALDDSLNIDNLLNSVVSISR